MGTERFPKATYLHDIGFQNYDFFLILSCSRFTEIDTWLGNEIKSRGKKFYYVRTKIGDDISGDRKAHPRSHKEGEVLQRIRDNIMEHLNNTNAAARMYLIDSYKRQKFDFNELEQNLINDFPALKRQALVMSMSVFSEKMVKEKVAELSKRMWKTAALSAGIAAIPSAGSSIAVDFALVLRESEFYFAQLGLDEKSLRQTAAMSSVSYDKLKGIVERFVLLKCLSVQGLRSLAAALPQAAVSPVFEEAAMFIPRIAPPVSFGCTYCVLSYMLRKMETVALEVVKAAIEESAIEKELD